MENYLKKYQNINLPNYIGSQLFIAAVAKALEHRLFDINRLETVLLQDIAQKDYQLPLGFEAQDCENLPQYREGAATPEPDLKDYLPPTEGDNDDAR